MSTFTYESDRFLLISCLIQMWRFLARWPHEHLEMWLCAHNYSFLSLENLHSRVFWQILLKSIFSLWTALNTEACMFSLCMHGFSPGTPAFSFHPSIFYTRLIRQSGCGGAVIWGWYFVCIPFCFLLLKSADVSLLPPASSCFLLLLSCFICF